MTTNPRGNMTVVTFELEKQTPGALRYQEIDGNGKPVRKDEDGAKVNTLYLRKHWLNGKAPNRITVSIQTE